MTPRCLVLYMDVPERQLLICRIVPEWAFSPSMVPINLCPLSAGYSSYRVEPLRGGNPYNGVGLAFAFE